MRKSAFTTVFLIAILLTGAIATASVSMIDTEASSDKKDKKKDRDRDHERDYDKKDKERDYKKDKERDYDKKDKERDYDDDKRYDDYRDYKSERDYEDYEDDKYDGKDKDKYDYDYDKHPKKLYKSYPKQYSESYDVKSHKKIKIIDCNNLNVNADELEDLQKLEPRIKKAIASNNVEDDQQQLASYSEYSHNSPYTRVYYIEPDTKVIFKCNNENQNLISNENSDVADTDTTTTPIERLGVIAPAAAESNNTSTINATETVETLQTGNVTSDTNSTMQSSPSMPSDTISTPQSTEVPFIFPIPRTVG